MISPIEPSSLSQGIQLAIAPVFLLTAVASLIGAVATRLARIIDRARVLEERLEEQIAKNVAAAYRELDRLRVRGRLVNASMMLLTLCAVLIGLTVMELFQVGAPNPDLKTSPIIDEYEEISLDMELEAETCYFNDVAHPIGQ